MSARRRTIVVALIAPLVGCAGGHGTGQPQTATSVAPSAAAERAAADTAGTNPLPAGFGSLRQDDIALRVQTQGVLVKAIPLDESVIRVLSPDSYRALHELAQSKREQVMQASSRYGVRQPSVWYVSFYGLEQGARFTPQEISIMASGRDFRPLEVLPLTAGFGENRLRQRETQAALYVFEGGVDLEQGLVFTVQNERNGDWVTMMPRIERERALVRSRAAQRPTPQP